MQLVTESRTLWLGLLLSALVAGIPAPFGGTASASTVDLWSLPSMGSNNKTGTNTSVLDSPVWALPTSSQYQWISYGDTGCNTFVVATNRCTAGPENPVGALVTGAATATFYQTFTLGVASSGVVNVWADDTASVWLDNGIVTSGDGSGGTMMVAANGTLGSNCSNGPIGCTTSNDATISLNLAAGTYTLVIDAYQLTGGTPFGVMYDGSLAPLTSQTPEPASYMLMGLGLAGLGAIVRRRKRA